jgi:hypothetical protein
MVILQGQQAGETELMDRRLAWTGTVLGRIGTRRLLARPCTSG